MISAAWRRAPCTNTPASVRGGSPTATLAISVAVSIASQRPLIPTPPQRGRRNAERGTSGERSVRAARIQPGRWRDLFRVPRSAFRVHEPSPDPSPYLLQLSDLGLITVTQPKVPIERRRPRAGPLGPFDEHDGALARHVVESEVAGFVRRLEAIAVDVVHGRGAGLVMMHQRLWGARRQRPGAQPTANGLHQGRLARPELAGQPDHNRRGEAPAKLFTEPVQLVRAEPHRAPHPLRP